MILRLTFMGNFWYIDLMRLLFVADGRSPIAQNWIRYFVERGDEVYLASTFACSVDFPLKGLEITPVAFSDRAQTGQSRARWPPTLSTRLQPDDWPAHGHPTLPRPIDHSARCGKIAELYYRSQARSGSCHENSLRRHAGRGCLHRRAFAHFGLGQ